MLQEVRGAEGRSEGTLRPKLKWHMSPSTFSGNMDAPSSSSSEASAETPIRELSHASSHSQAGPEWMPVQL